MYFFMSLNHYPLVEYRDLSMREGFQVAKREAQARGYRDITGIVMSGEEYNRFREEASRDRLWVDGQCETYCGVPFHVCDCVYIQDHIENFRRWHMRKAQEALAVMRRDFPELFHREITLPPPAVRWIRFGMTEEELDAHVRDVRVTVTTGDRERPPSKLHPLVQQDLADRNAVEEAERGEGVVLSNGQRSADPEAAGDSKPAAAAPAAKPNRLVNFRRSVLRWDPLDSF